MVKEILYCLPLHYVATEEVKEAIYELAIFSCNILFESNTVSII